jgi:hypothetical protein
VSFHRWLLVYLATGSSFTRLAILAFFGGAAVVVGLLVFAALVALGPR